MRSPSSPHSPSIPKAWDGFKISRLFRGATYNVTVKNPDHVSSGVKSMTVDGTAVDGCVIPFDASKKEVNVEVVMG